MPDEMTYASSGVDIEAAQRAIRGVSDAIRATKVEGVVGGIGGFGAMFSAIFSDYSDPILVSSIDGVGTKTKVANMAGIYDWLGHDIVNHCINDILCQGARPLFFLDYYGCSRLKENVFQKVVSGMAAACEATGTALIGGETAEMPGVYVDEEIDVVGSIVGIVESELRYPKRTVAGDAVIGIASNGLHTNGFSLARKALFEAGNLSVRDVLSDGQTTIAEALLAPHRCYFNSVFPLLGENSPINAIAHLTGGGFYDNIPRVLSSNTRVVIEKRAWDVPEIFQLIQNAGNIAEEETYHAFNMGIGMVLIVERSSAPAILDALTESGETAMLIGETQAGNPEVHIF
jgi:phosphoribosylformylglycinamidine cyclo-ligase